MKQIIFFLSSESCTRYVWVIIKFLSESISSLYPRNDGTFDCTRKRNERNSILLPSASRAFSSIFFPLLKQDNLLKGVNDKIAEKLGLQNCKVLLPKNNLLKKLVTFCPIEDAESIKNALFEAGAGNVGNYSECSFNLEGKDTFKGGEESNPFVGEKGKRHSENETRIEVIFPVYLQQVIIENLKKNHPYEEVAYYISSLDNDWQETGSGLVGELAEPISEQELFTLIKNKFNLTIVRHSAFLNKKVQKIALCGGSGFFLLPNAIAAGADAYITGDVKYHEFFDADGKILLADIGHYESEQFTIQLLAEFLQNKYPNFAVQKTEINTNSVNYFIQLKRLVLKI